MDVCNRRRFWSKLCWEVFPHIWSHKCASGIYSSDHNFTVTVLKICPYVREIHDLILLIKLTLPSAWWSRKQWVRSTNFLIIIRSLILLLIPTATTISWLSVIPPLMVSCCENPSLAKSVCLQICLVMNLNYICNVAPLLVLSIMQASFRFFCLPELFILPQVLLLNYYSLSFQDFVVRCWNSLAPKLKSFVSYPFSY